MIITTEKETILGNGAKSKAFSIAANPKVFKILSSEMPVCSINCSRTSIINLS